MHVEGLQGVLSGYQVSEEQLARLPALLGRPGASDVATQRAATCIRLFVHCQPGLKPLMLSHLEAELHRWGGPCPGSRCMWLRLCLRVAV